jgi:hypothetical protein
MVGNNTWTPIPNAIFNPAVCVPNNIMTVDFPTLKTQQVRFLFKGNKAQGTFVGISEIEIWAPWPQGPVGYYEAEGVEPV